MVHHQEKVNPYNVFKSEKAAEVHENGGKMNVPELHKEYYDEYAHLTDEEKAELVQRFSDNRADGVIHRDTPCARVQDVANGEKTAVTTRWDQAAVGAKVEAFALAGCDMMNLLRTAPQKAAYAKREICNMIVKGLIDITGKPNAAMAYVNYEEYVVHRYGVELTGWTPDKWCSLSELTSSIPVLRMLLNALKAGGMKKRKRVVNNENSADDDYPSDDDEDADATASTTHRQYSVKDPEAPAPPTKRCKALAPVNDTLPRMRKTTAKPTVSKATAAKPRPKAKAVRKDDKTLAALQHLKDGRAPGSGGGRGFKSRAIINDDEDEDDAPAITDTSAPALPTVVVTDATAPVVNALTTVV
ncbi:hypothetical protein B0H17DRAFT_1198912 [Mycena rosella]|uniref:Uncharacterized protein n=1 Tax=Mycena rosella TaxID=1033263 RepID=A0AAD7DN43_MYCRO|nr:hypothetical protein B0H17DRAFT_1198912 [Mycena rosella]